jgi:thiamine biosynthesis lipoprotein
MVPDLSQLPRQKHPDNMLRRLEFHAMGSEMLAVLESNVLSQTLPAVTQWFEEWEQVLSRFRYDSELTRLNQTHGRPIQVSRILWDVFQAALQAEQMTEGLVTPTVLEAMLDAGYDRPFDEMRDITIPLTGSINSVDSPRLEVSANEADRTITLTKGIGLDFGGVAKGWAAHQAMQRLQAEGPALVDAAGDIAISGPRADGGPWQIGVANPFHKGEEIEVLFLDRCGVATSGKDRRRWLRDGALKHHIINPVTNQPAETDVLTVTVVAPNVMQAEAAAKAAFIQGSRSGLGWIEAHPDFAALFILDNGQLVYSNKMDEYL